MIRFNKNNNHIEPFIVILCNRNQEHLGAISNISNMNFKGNMNSADELSFEVHKTIDGYEDPLWGEIFDLRLVYIRDLDEYFEINVSYTDQTHLTKTITATSLCEAELSQTILYDIEINTETDISRENYEVAKFWTTISPTSSDYEEAIKNTILYRVLEKVPAYKVKHVDITLCNLQRVFNINGTSVYDWLVGDCVKEFNCLVKFDSTDRTISFYDLYTTCPVCHSRGLYNEVCTHIITENDIKKYGVNGLINGKGIGDVCGNTDLNYYGEDTTILVSTENLTDEIKYETNIGAVKNSFRLVAGDDDMTAAVININPNGTQYITRYSPESLRDMPEVLTNALNAYDDLYYDCKYKREYPMNTSYLSQYNQLVRFYNDKNRYPASHDKEKLDEIPSSIRGYTNVTKFIYQSMDFYSYLESSMMPTVEIGDVNVNTEVAKLNALSGVVALSTFSNHTNADTVNSAVLNYAKIYVKTGFVNVEIDKANTIYRYVEGEPEHGIWIGRFIVTDNSISDDNDEYKSATTNEITFTINGEYDKFMQQKIAKKITKDNEDNDTYDVLNIQSLDTFKDRITYYSLNRLQSFKDSLDAVLGILQEAGQGTAEKVAEADRDSVRDVDKFYYNIRLIKNPSQHDINLVKETHLKYTKAQTAKAKWERLGYTAVIVIEGSELYEDFYLPYYRKYKAVELEYNKRASELNMIATYVRDTMTAGVLYNLLQVRNNVHDILNLQSFLNNYSQEYDLYKLLSTYTRQDEYNNSNYISTGLDNDKLFQMAEMFYDAAEEELLKSSTYQHTLTANLYNLLAMEEFSPIVNSFELGNWIQVMTDGNLYRLRLISYSVDFEDPTTLNTEFSDLTTVGSGFNDIQSILSKASSMSTSYPAITRQAELGELAKLNIDEWVERGLNSAKTRIMNNNDEEIEISNVGMTAKTYNDITDDYDNEQLRVTHNVLAFTDDGWETVKAALGKFTLTHHLPHTSNKKEYQVEEYGLVANAVLAGWVVGSHFEAGDIISSYIQNVGNTTYIDLGNTTENFISVSDDNGVERFSIDKDGNFFSVAGHIGWPRKWPGEQSYIDINGDDTKYKDWIHLISLGENKESTFIVSKADASIKSSGGHFSNLSDSNYIDLGSEDNDYDFLRCDGVFSVNKEGYLYSTRGQIGGFYIGDNFLTTNKNGANNHGENDITLGSQSFHASIKTVTYNEAKNIIEPSTASLGNYRFAIGNYFGVTTDGEYYCLENRASNVITGDLKANLGKFTNKLEITDSTSHDDAYYTTITGGSITSNWVHSASMKQSEIFWSDIHDSVIIQKTAFKDNGQVQTYFGSEQYFIPWMTATSVPTPPSSLPHNCIYLIYEGANTGTADPIPGDVTQDIFPSV